MKTIRTIAPGSSCTTKPLSIHWNFHPVTVEQMQHWITEPNYRPDLDLVAVAPDGTYAGFCCGSFSPEANHHHQAIRQRRLRRAVGWINVLGTRRGFRRMGLGRALLLAGLHRLRSAGIEVARLGVDIQNPNRALSLYESIGFQPIKTRLIFSQAIE